jgi:hypothetical protein
MKALKAKAKAKTKTKPIANNPESDLLNIITYAAIKRVANRNGIAAISGGCVNAVQDYITMKALECFLHARSSAQYISKTRTVHSRELASAVRTSNFGELVCV